MSYQKQAWRDYDDTKTELQNLQNGAVVTPERMNHIETGIANSANKEEVTAQLAQTEQELEIKKADKTHVWSMGNMGQDIKEALTGGSVAVVGKNTVLRENIVEGQVYPDRTTFAKSKNIAGPLVENFSLQGPAEDMAFGDTEGGYSFITRGSSGKDYTVSKGESNRFRIAVHGKYPVVGEKVDRVVKSSDTGTRHTFTLEENEQYIIVYVSNDGNPPSEFQIEEGRERTDYVDPGKSVTIDFEDESIPVESLQNLSGSFKSTGTLIGQSSAFNLSLETETIKTNGSGRVYVDNERIELIEGEWNYSHIETLSVLIVFNKLNQNILFYPSTETLSKNDVLLGVIRKNDGTYHINGLHHLEGEPVISYTKREIDNSSSYKPKIFLPDFVNGNYSSDIPYVDKTRDIDLIYDIYDEGLNANQNYASKELLANDESGLPIYKYELKPIGMDTSLSLPKIIYTCVHGHENSATYGGALFFRDLMLNWRDNPILKFLRWNVHFIIIPNLNPWGFNNNKRPNFNGVDLARNFSSGWSASYTDIDYNYPGTEPLSEVGTQVFDQLLQQHSDALFAIDHHNYGGNPHRGGELLWTGTNDGKIKDLIDQYTYNMVVQSKFNFDIEEDLRLGRAIMYDRGGSACRQMNYRGVDGMIIEAPHEIYQSPEDGQKFNSNAVGNAILSALRYYSR